MTLATLFFIKSVGWARRVCRRGNYGACAWAQKRAHPTWLFHGFIPEAWVAEHLASGNWYDVPTAVVVGVPLYSNATGIIPVAEAMLTKGVAVGTTLALMMSVAALSLPEMLILRKVIKWQALALFAAVLATAFVLVGWVFNLIA